MMAESDGQVKGKWESFEFPLTLKLISSPNKIELTSITEAKKTEFKEIPQVILESAESDKTYTLVFIDPDAPLHYNEDAILHWMVNNIKGSDLRNGDLSKGKTVTDYRGPGPLIFTGLHRYIFLLFEEEEVNQTINLSHVKRLKFKIREWLDSQSKKLHGPIAGMQFLSKF